MSAPSEKDPPQGLGLPDPELNPLTNPLLAKNMGRWAEVYYTSPPEKRDEAVQELLRELKEQESDNPEQAANSRTAETPQTLAIAEPESDSRSSAKDARASAPEEPVCPACLHKNRVGDHYCGLCGFPLKSDHKQESPEIKPIEKPAAPAPAAAPLERTEQSWEWLRERNLASFGASSQPLDNAWKYLPVLAVLALCSVIVYAVWGRSGTRATPRTPPPPQTVTVPLSQTPEQHADTKPAPPPPVEPTSPATQISDAQPEVTNNDSGQTLQPTTAEDVPVVDGRQELDQAKRYLQGKGVPKSSTAAAVLLWRSVAKQNPEAVLLLSDLYVRGDGVPQSCDQARLLLSAAAKRGSAEAGEKLAILQNAGCH